MDKAIPITLSMNSQYIEVLDRWARGNDITRSEAARAAIEHLSDHSLVKRGLFLVFKPPKFRMKD